MMLSKILQEHERVFNLVSGKVLEFPTIKTLINDAVYNFIKKNKNNIIIITKGLERAIWAFQYSQGIIGETSEVKASSIGMRLYYQDSTMTFCHLPASVKKDVFKYYDYAGILEITKFSDSKIKIVGANKGIFAYTFDKIVFWRDSGKVKENYYK